MKLTLTIILTLILAFGAFGQEYEYGKPAELKGLTKIFIDAGTDVKSYNSFTDEIEKAKLPLKVVTEMKDAEIILVYKGGMVDAFYGGTTLQRSSGKGFIAIQGKNPDKPRILMNFESVKNNVLEKKPSEKFVKEFIKEYKKANK
jgi:hypothetical protein